MNLLFRHDKKTDKELSNILQTVTNTKTIASRADAKPNWFNGEGVPSRTLGKENDYYIDKTANKVYVKEGNSWL